MKLLNFYLTSACFALAMWLTLVCCSSSNINKWIHYPADCMKLLDFYLNLACFALATMLTLVCCSSSSARKEASPILCSNSSSSPNKSFWIMINDCHPSDNPSNTLTLKGILNTDPNLSLIQFVLYNLQIFLGWLARKNPTQNTRKKTKSF